MKYTCYMMILAALGTQLLWANNIEGQTLNEVRVNLKAEHKSLKEIFKLIEKKSNFRFVYNEKLVSPYKGITLLAKDKTLASALYDILFKTDLGYVEKDRKIIIVEKEPDTVKAQLPPKTIKGKVVDAANRPLEGASIRVKGTSIATSTNAQGEYSINVPDGNDTLVIAFVGYITREVLLNNRSTITVQLTEENKALNDVIVIGYGTQKRSDLTGSVVSVKPSEIQQTPITSIDQGLVGRASGVLVTQTSGMPGAIASIRIRGSSSLQGGNEPLYIIDGVPVYNGSGFGQTGGNVQMSGLSTINPSDIESIEILKDASATAIYGSRAANGVVLITTKGGKRGRDVISFDSYYGTQSVVKKIDVMDATNYAKLVNEAYTNDGLAAPYSTGFIASIPNQGKGTDWQNEIFRSAPIRNYQLTFSGGDGKTTYSASANYLNQDGIIINSNFERYSGRLNFNRKMNDKFSISSHMSVSRIISNTVETDVGGEGGVITGAMKFNPILPIYQDANLHIYNLVNQPGSLYPNPVATALEMKRKNNATRVLGDFSGEFTIMEGLKAKVLFGIDYFMQKAGRYTPSNIYQSGGVASAAISDAMYTNWLNENTLTYFKKFDNHTITLLAGATFQKNRSENVFASAQGFVNDVLQYNSLGSGSVYNQPGSGATEWGIMSFLGRANYSYKGKYLFTASGRYDGSSRFGKNNKYAFFPSVAFAWKASEENFIKKLNVFSNLKLRTSFGVTGNQEIGLYNSLPTLSPVTYTIGGQLVSGFFPNTIPNPDLKWERTAQYDAGLDMGFFNNRVTLTVDWYLKKTTDLIYSVAIPFVSGFATSLQNIGSVQNRGIEIALETNNLDKALKWTTSFNISFNKNKVLELGGEKYKEIGGGDDHLKTGPVHRLIVGQPIGIFYGYVFDGIFQDQAAVNAGPKGPTNWVGGRRYKDISGPAGVPDGKVDATYDRTIIGDPNPVFYGGLANTFSYKGWEMSVFLQYSYGNKILNYNAIELSLPSGGQNVYADLINRWTPTNPSNIYPKATTNRSAVFSSQYVEDGSYMKVKTVTLSYLLPHLKTKYINGLRVYVTGQNLLTSTRYRGYDPEVSYRGASNLEIGEDYGGYPQSRTFLFGVRFDLR